MEYSNLKKILHVELDKKLGHELVCEMISNFNVEQTFNNFVKVCSTLKFADDFAKREYIKSILKNTFGDFFKSCDCKHYEESCEFVNILCKIYFQYVIEMETKIN